MFVHDGDSMELAACKYARILVQVGLFEEAVTELHGAKLHIEATFLALAFNEMGLLKTKHGWLTILRSSSQLSRERSILS